MDRTLKLVAIAVALVGAGLLALLLLVTHEKSAAFRTVDAPHPEAAGGSYVVAMSPMGEVRFPHVPAKIVTLDDNYNDLLVGVHAEGGLRATGYRGNHYDGFYRQLTGTAIDLDMDKLTYLARAGGGGFDKELLYTLRPDVFHIDPLLLAKSKGWSEADVDEVARNVAPFFANRYSRDCSYSGTKPYAYYSIFEMAAKMGEVYQRPGRVQALQAVYDRLLADITAKLPPEEQRPRIGLIFTSKGKFTPYSLLNGGFGQAQYRDLHARDAFAPIKDKTYGAVSAAAVLDLEGLVALAPDVLIVPFAIYPAAGGAATSHASYEELLKLKDDPLAQRIPAFRDGRVYPGGTPLQGPVFYLFQLEMAAKQIYPALFGTYRDDQDYPPAERLFDRARVAAAIAGTTGQP